MELRFHHWYPNTWIEMSDCMTWNSGPHEALNHFETVPTAYIAAPCTLIQQRIALSVGGAAELRFTATHGYEVLALHKSDTRPWHRGFNFVNLVFSLCHLFPIFPITTWKNVILISEFAFVLGFVTWFHISEMNQWYFSFQVGQKCRTCMHFGSPPLSLLPIALAHLSP